MFSIQNYPDQQTPEEGGMSQRLKHCDNNINQNKDIIQNLNNINNLITPHSRNPEKNSTFVHYIKYDSNITRTAKTPTYVVKICSKIVGDFVRKKSLKTQ